MPESERRVEDSCRTNSTIESALDGYDAAHNDDQEPGSGQVSPVDEVKAVRRSDPKSLPYWLTVKEAAEWLRTTSKAIYARNERGQLPGAVRDGRRLLVQRDALLASLTKLLLPSPRGTRR
jgi:excisionase family DNA binding protein